MTDIAGSLEAMLDVLDDKDWIQDDLFEGPHGLRGDEIEVPLDEVTGVCLAGSYTYAVLTGAVSANDWWAVSSVILPAAVTLFPDRFVFPFSVPAFNDHKDTTVEDVKLVVKGAIEKVREAA